MQQATAATTTPCDAPSLLTPIGASYYARSKALCPQHYNELMDRGWRRSGSLLYIPDVSRSCCPHYTIRLPASEFRPTRDQRQAIHRWNRYVLGEKYINEVARKYPKSKEEKKMQSTTFDLKTAIHESESSNLKPDIEPAHKFEVVLEPDTITEEKFALFANYQSHVHKESHTSRSGFKNFLCASPLHRHTTSTGKPLGSFHQTYRLDGRLIAMAVLDLLPHGVSGVYFMYHSDFEKWSFGKLSALRETALALEAGYEWYYMGYFIWSCKKMRYKGDYRPQHVLDYDSLGWDVMDADMMGLMGRRRWVCMSRERAVRAVLETEKGRDEDVVAGAEVEEHEGGGEDTTVSRVVVDVSQAVHDSSEQDLVDFAYKVEYPTPTLAMQSGRSILDLAVPGVMTLDALTTQITLEDMKVTLGHGTVHRMRDIMSWYDGLVTDPTSIRGIIAELAATIGPALSEEIVVDLSR